MLGTDMPPGCEPGDIRRGRRGYDPERRANRVRDRDGAERRRERAEASAVLELNIPYGIDVEVEELPAKDSTAQVRERSMNDDDLVSGGKLNIGTSLISIDAQTGLNDNDGVVITIESKDDLQPGFYTIAGRVFQTSGQISWQPPGFE